MDTYQIIYQRHAIERMALREVREEDVERVVHTGETIETYARIPLIQVNYYWDGVVRDHFMSLLQRIRHSKEKLLLLFTCLIQKSGTLALKGERNHEMRYLQIWRDTTRNNNYDARTS